MGKEGKKDGEIPAEEIVILSSSYQHKSESAVVVGKLCCKKVLNKATVKGMIHTSWGLDDSFVIGDAEPDVFIFNFKSLNIVKEIMSHAPWIIMGILSNGVIWNQALTIRNIDFS